MKYDEETGSRYYDPRVSLWLNVDPLVEQTMTPYQYVNQNPIRYTDPTGMAGDDWVNVGGEMIYDSRVTNQETATKFHGEGAQYREVGYSYTSSTGEDIELGDHGFFKSNRYCKVLSRYGWKCFI